VLPGVVPPAVPSSKRPWAEMVSGASNRAPAFEMRPIRFCQRLIAVFLAVSLRFSGVSREALALSVPVPARSGRPSRLPGGLADQTPVRRRNSITRPGRCQYLHSLNLSSQPFAPGDHLTKILFEPGRRGLRQKFPVAVSCCAIIGGRLLL
jgi:hypothetical protein